MRPSLSVLCLFSLSLVPLSQVVGPAVAQSRIGAASLVQHDVSGLLAGRARAVAQGDGVFANEVIRTADASAARLVFLDETNLSIGPSASVKLDRFVYNPDRSAKTVVVNATRGAFRWVSGASDPRAYQVRTPLATIGVRGTVFDLLVEARRVVVMLRQGAVVVCPNGSRRCAMMTNPGEVVTVTPGRFDGPFPGAPGGSDFANRCLSATSRAFCTVTAGIVPEDRVPPPRRARVEEPPVYEQPPVAPVIDFAIGILPGLVGGRGSGVRGGDYGGRPSGTTTVPPPGRGLGGSQSVPRQ